MEGSRFLRYELRTTDEPAARAFYADVLGPDLWNVDVTSSVLPEQALARGARPHWLGHLGVADPEGVVEALVPRGAQQLGPLRHGPGGSRNAVLRDPFGAIVALSSETTVPRPGIIAWRNLNVADMEGAVALYTATFGWRAGEVRDLGEAGHHRPFGWGDEAPEGEHGSGSISDAARLPGIHTHWFFAFRVGDLETAVARVRARGGLATKPIRTDHGAWVVPCDDAQGAAFGLWMDPAP